MTEGRDSKWNTSWIHLAEFSLDSLSCDEVRNGISENGTTEVLHLEPDGNNDNGVEEDGANDSSDDEFLITNVSKMASYDEQMAQLNEMTYCDELGTSSSDSDDPENNWLKQAQACTNGEALVILMTLVMCQPNLWVHFYFYKHCLDILSHYQLTILFKWQGLIRIVGLKITPW